MKHPSQLQLDALHLGAGDATTRAHVTGCEACRERMRADAIEHRYFLASVLPRQAIGRSRRTWWIAASAFATVAAVVLMFARAAPEEPALGIKGGPSVEIYANQDGRVLRVHDGTPLRPADRIRFVVIGAARQHVTITSIDGAGHATDFFTGVPDAVRYEVPGSVILDGTLGPERIHATIGTRRIPVVWFQKVTR